MEKDGSLDPDERKRFDDWITAHWRHGACSVCGANDWSRAEKVHQVVNVATFLPDGTSYPVVSFMCQVCGYTILVNAITAGIVTRETPLSSGESADAEAGAT